MSRLTAASPSDLLGSWHLQKLTKLKLYINYFIFTTIFMTMLSYKGSIYYTYT